MLVNILLIIIVITITYISPTFNFKKVIGTFIPIVIPVFISIYSGKFYAKE